MKNETSGLAPSKIASTQSASAVGGGWPGFVFVLGPGIFRGLGYFAVLLAGVCMAQRDPFWIFLLELLIGHFLICAAEVVGQMNDERKRESSANVGGEGRTPSDSAPLSK